MIIQEVYTKFWRGVKIGREGGDRAMLECSLNERDVECKEGKEDQESGCAGGYHGTAGGS